MDETVINMTNGDVKKFTVPRVIDENGKEISFWTAYHNQYKHIRQNYYKNHSEELKEKQRQRYNNNPEAKERAKQRALARYYRLKESKKQLKEDN